MTGKLRISRVYQQFPFRITEKGAKTSGRAAHVREQIEQVLFTMPGERIFRPGFGAGVPSLVFEPNTSALWEVTKKRIETALIDTLKGEADPKTLKIRVFGEQEKLFIEISYTLSALGLTEHHRFEADHQSPGDIPAPKTFAWLPESWDAFTPAQSPSPVLTFKENPDGSLGACKREITLPGPLPEPGDDFDWHVRDYDGFRFFMLEELASRFPERKRWTPADIEVVIAELLAGVLDWLSDKIDRVAAEAFLETARHPASVFRLLKFIGYDPLAKAPDRAGLKEPVSGEPVPDAVEKLYRFWLDHPHEMETARRTGPQDIHQQERMVTVTDYARELAGHPLVYRASARNEWGGSWPVIRIAVVLWDNASLDADISALPGPVHKKVADFHRKHRLPVAGNGTLRDILGRYIEACRMAGQEVQLEDCTPVGIELGITLFAAPHYFRSEIRDAVSRALGSQPDGFFAPGRLKFGQDLLSSDIIASIMALDGIENISLTRFKRVGTAHPDCSASGRIVLSGLEIAVCDNDPAGRERGFFQLRFKGGRRI